MYEPSHLLIYFYGQVVILLKKLCLMLFFCVCLNLTAGAMEYTGGTSAAGCALLDGETGRVLYQKEGDTPRPMASTTKIMTAVVALENGCLEEKVTITQESVGVEGSSLYLKEGEQLTLEELLYGMLLESGNDAAVAIALHIGGSVEEFVGMMNQKAKELGLKQTHFENPNGLTAEGHQTTPIELGKLTSYALQNETFAQIVSTKEKTISGGDDGQRYLTNSNKMLRNYEGAVGVKTGFTKVAGRCLVSAAEREGVQLVCVTLNDGDDWKDHTQLLDWGFSQLKKQELSPEKERTLPVAGAGDVTVRLPKVELTLSEEDQVEMVTELPRFCYGPIEEGQVLGQIWILVNGEETEALPITAQHGVELPQKISWWKRLLPF
jgi:D-alanyl-D-alanine carboxypeptidase (penicillin-binding protein 5/6)